MPPRSAPACRPRSPEPDRRAWLDVQLVALETQAAALAGDALPYLDHVTRCFDHTPRLDPGRTVRRRGRADRRASPRRRHARGPAGRVGRRGSRSRSTACRPSSTGSSARFRALPLSVFGLPDGEDLRVSLVTGPAVERLQLVRWRPALADRRQHGPARPRTEPAGPGRPRGVPRPPPRARHEGGRAGGPAGPPRVLDPAHQHAGVPHQRGTGRPRRTVRGARRRNASTSSSRSSSAPGLADRHGSGRDPREPPSVAVAIETHRATLGTIGGNVALLRHVEGRSHDEVRRLPQGCRPRLARHVAEKRLEFIEHPLWRTYIFVYAEGEALLERWVDAVPESERAGAVRAPAPRAADAGGGQISRLNTTRSSPSAS